MPKPLVSPDGEVRELGEDFFARATRGRPALPADARKRRVNLMLDPEVAARLRGLGNASAFVNGLLREKLEI